MISLLVIRGLMGFAEGAYVPAIIVATLEASRPQRKGLNIGIQQMAAPAIGLGLGPLIAVILLGLLPSWHWVFGVVAIPGLILAYFLARHLRHDMPTTLSDQEKLTKAPNVPFRQVFRCQNVISNTLGMCCWLSCMVVLSAFMPSYLVDYMGLDLSQMSMVLAGMGVGTCVGMVALPALSDKTGRKPILLVAVLSMILVLPILLYSNPSIALLAGVMFLTACMAGGIIAITVGPLTSESVPAAVTTSATGLVVGVGEIVGGAIAPAIAGAIAHQMGIVYIVHFALGAVIVGFIVTALGTREPLPSPTSAVKLLKRSGRA